MNRKTYVFADWGEPHDAKSSAPQLIGELACDLLRGKEHFCLAYDKEWLNTACAQQIDPELHLLQASRIEFSHFLGFVGGVY